MVIAELHVVGIPVAPSKADTPLIVDADAVLADTASRQRLRGDSGSTRRNARLAALSIRSSFRLALTATSLGKPCRTYRPEESAAVRLSANVLITADRPGGGDVGCGGTMRKNHIIGLSRLPQYTSMMYDDGTGTRIDSWNIIRRRHAVAEIEHSWKSRRRSLRTAAISGKAHAAGMDMHAAELGAAMQCRKHLAGIEQALVVERAFEPLLLIEIDLGKHHRHQIALLDADAMLAGQHAADLDAQPQDIGAELLRPAPARPACWHRRGSADANCRRRHETHWRRARPYFADNSFMRCSTSGSLRARNGAVHAIIIRRDAADRGKRRLAAGPEQQPLLLGVGDAAASPRRIRRASSSTRSSR